MVVISDTSCLSALLRVGQLSLLQALFGTITIPEKVGEELLRLTTFGVDVSPYLKANWILKQSPTNSPLLQSLLLQLDEGEAQAIALAIDSSADWLIIDELKGRKIASALSINIIGLAGVLLLAKKEGHIDAVKPLLSQILRETSFRVSQALQEHILKAAGE